MRSASDIANHEAAFGNSQCTERKNLSWRTSRRILEDNLCEWCMQADRSNILPLQGVQKTSQCRAASHQVRQWILDLVQLHPRLAELPPRSRGAYPTTANQLLLWHLYVCLRHASATTCKSEDAQRLQLHGEVETHLLSQLQALIGSSARLLL